MNSIGEFKGGTDATKTHIIVIGYGFYNDAKLTREACLGADLINIRKTFGSFSCQIHEFIGLKKQELFDTLDGELFDRSEGNAELLIVFVLSHGLSNGLILTDTKLDESGNYEMFNKNDIFKKLGKNCLLKDALQIYFMGPCRGIIRTEHFSPDSLPSKNLDDPPPPLITNSTAQKNRIIFYSTFEENMAIFDAKGTWLVQTLCTEIAELKEMSTLEILLTKVIKAIVGKSTKSLAQSPELIIYPHQAFIFKSYLGTDAQSDRSKVVIPERLRYFSWTTDAGDTLEQGRAFIFYDELHQGVASEFEESFLALGLTVRKFEAQLICTELTKVAKYLDKDDGMILVCTLTKLIHTEESGFVISHSGPNNISGVTGHFSSKNCHALIGKPKVYIFMDCEQRSDCVNNKSKVVTNRGNNNADSLTFVGKGRELCDCLLSELKEMYTSKRSLQEVFKMALNSWPSDSREEMPFMMSTMPYLLDFPKIGSPYMKPILQLEKFGASNYDIMDMHYDSVAHKVLKCFHGNKELERNVFVISSEPGTGKTRVTKELNKHLLSNQINVVEICAKKCEDNFNAFENFKSIVNSCEKREVTNLHKTALLLDGIDEICPKLQSKVLKFVNQASKIVPFLLITTRPQVKGMLVNYIERDINVNWLTFKKLEPPEIDFFLQRLLKDVEDWSVSWNIIRKQTELDTWSPLVLQMLAQLMKSTDKRDIFRDQVSNFSIYWHLTDLQVQQTYKNRTLLQNITQLDIKKALIGTAVCYTMERKKMIDNFNDFKDVIDKSGVAFFEGRKLSFVHQTYAEFLMCLALLFPGNKFFSKKEINSILLKPRFANVRRFLDDALLFDFGDGSFFSAENFLKNEHVLTIVKSNDTKIVDVTCKEGLCGIYKTIVKKNLIPSLDVNQLLISTCSLIDFGYARREELAMDLLKDRGVDVVEILENELNQSKLMTVIARFNYCELLKMLPAEKILPEILNSGVLMASCHGNLKCIQILVEYGADIKMKMSSGFTILHKAAESGNAELVQWVLQFFDVDVRTDADETPLYFATSQGHVEAVHVLINEGADVRAVERKLGRNMLHTAVSSGSQELIELFLKQGLNVNQGTDKDGETPLHIAAEKGNVEAMEKLLQRGALLDAKDRYGRNVLHHVADRYSERSIGFLLMYKLNIDSTENYGMTPVMFAVRRNNHRGVQELMRRGASASLVDNEGYNVLHHAIRSRNLEMVKQLVSEFGSEPNTKTKDGDTPLHLAEKVQHLEIFKYLLDHGADPMLTNADGKKPSLPPQKSFGYPTRTGADIFRSLFCFFSRSAN